MAGEIQNAHALLSYFDQQHRKRYKGTPASINRIKQRWDMKLLYEDLGMVGVKQTIDYYFALNRPHHSLNWFFNNYDRMIRMHELQELDKQKRVELQHATKKRSEEFREKYGSGSKTDQRGLSE
jgi:hypothetical protein